MYYGSHRKAFPEKLLPKEVLRRRAEAAAGRVETWTPSIEALEHAEVDAEAEG